MVFGTFQKDLPNSHEDVKSNTEIGNGWTLKELKIALNNLALDLQYSC